MILGLGLQQAIILGLVLQVMINGMVFREANFAVMALKLSMIVRFTFQYIMIKGLVLKFYDYRYGL
jgi:hypothetical protein